MRIGFDAKRLYHNNTGLGNYSRDLVRIISAKMFDSTFFLYNPKPGNIKKYSIADNNIEKQPKTFFYKKLSSLWRSKGVLKQLKIDDIEIYHGLSGEIPSGIQKTNIKSIVTIHDLIFLEHPNLYKPIDRFTYNYKAKKACINADLVVSISEHTKKDIIKYYGISEDKIKVIYQGCHPAVKEAISDDQKKIVSKKYNLPESFILNVATIERRKNQEVIIKAIALLDNQKLVIVGRKTEYYKTIHNLIVQNNLQDRVIFLEGLTMDELATVYQMADIFIYPSLYEGFGIPIIESLFSGIPVITTKGGVFPEAGGQNSIYVNPDDFNAIADNIKDIQNNAQLRELIITEGKKYASQFTDDNIANKWEETYMFL